MFPEEVKCELCKSEFRPRWSGCVICDGCYRKVEKRILDQPDDVYALALEDIPKDGYGRVLLNTNYKKIMKIKEKCGWE